MLSDIGTTSSKFGLSFNASANESGDSSFDSISIGLSYRPFEWLQLSGAIPYMFIKGNEVIWDQYDTGGGIMANRRNEFRYDQDGMGDIMVMAWANTLYPFFDHPEGDEEPTTEEKEAFSEYPALYVGFGVKFDNADDDEFDAKKFAFDREKAITGEPNISDGILPSKYQLGTGTTDILVGLYYLQRFGDFTPSAGISYQFVGGENSVGYEKSDVFSWSIGTKYTLIQTEDCRQLYLNAGISGVTTTSRDYDHSEDTTKLLSQPRGRVAGTNETYTFYSFGAGYEITKSIMVTGGITLPLNDPDKDSNYSFDRAFNIGLQYRF